MSDEIGVDVQEQAAADGQARLGQHPRLEGEIVQVDILHAGRGLDLDYVPSVVRRWRQDVRAAVGAVGGEGSLKQRLAGSERLSGQADGFLQICDVLADLDPVRVELLGQRAHFVPLVEHRLLLGIRLWDQVLGVVSVPEELRALEAPKEFRFGDVRRGRIANPTRIRHCGPRHDGYATTKPTGFTAP